MLQYNNVLTNNLLKGKVARLVASASASLLVKRADIWYSINNRTQSIRPHVLRIQYKI